jgi:hypothetical protein
MAAIICAATAASGQRAMLDSTAARVTLAGSMAVSSVATRLTQATMSTPMVPSSLRAIAPAATRPTVSRALARPPPIQARMPYLAW